MRVAVRVPIYRMTLPPGHSRPTGTRGFHYPVELHPFKAACLISDALAVDWASFALRNSRAYDASNGSYAGGLVGRVHADSPVRNGCDLGVPGHRRSPRRRAVSWMRTSA